MKRFAFQFESVLHVKQQQLRLAEAAMTRCKQQLTAAETHFQEVVQHLGRVSEQLAQLMQSPSNVSDYVDCEERLQLLRDQKAVANLSVQKCKEAFGDALKKCQKLSAQVDGLATLRQEAWAEYRAESDKQQQAHVDEHVIRNWGS